MPRRRIADANKRGNQKPARKAADQTPESELAKRRRAVASLVAHNRSPDDIRSAMLHEFPDMPVAAIDKMRLTCERAFAEETPQVLSTERAKQSSRIYGHIGAALRKGQFSAVAQFEKILVDIKGTAAPRRIIVQSDAATKEKLAAVLVMLPQNVLTALAGGRFVPLGFSQSAVPKELIEAEGVPADDD